MLNWNLPNLSYVVNSKNKLYLTNDMPQTVPLWPLSDLQDEILVLYEQ